LGISQAVDSHCHVVQATGYQSLSMFHSKVVNFSGCR